jgi:hypothetical protein
MFSMLASLCCLKFAMEFLLQTNVIIYKMSGGKAGCAGFI